MTEKIHKTPHDDQLDHLIDSLLNGIPLEDLVTEKLDPETEEILLSAKQVISLSPGYPGTPELSSQDRIRLLTTYRSKHQRAAHPRRSRLLSNFQQNRIGWAGAATLVALAMFIVFRNITNPAAELQASAGLLPSILPYIALAAAAFVAAILLLRKK